MNTSFTKKRHILESNQRLENRYLTEQVLPGGIDGFFDEPEGWEDMNAQAKLDAREKLKRQVNYQPKNQPKPQPKPQPTVDKTLLVMKPSMPVEFTDKLNKMKLPMIYQNIGGSVNKQKITLKKPIIDTITQIDINDINKSVPKKFCVTTGSYPKLLPEFKDCNISMDFIDGSITTVIIDKINNTNSSFTICKSLVEEYSNRLYMAFLTNTDNVHLFILGTNTTELIVLNKRFFEPVSPQVTQIDWSKYKVLWEFLKSLGKLKLLSQSNSIDGFNSRWTTSTQNVRIRPEISQLYRNLLNDVKDSKTFNTLKSYLASY